MGLEQKERSARMTEEAEGQPRPPPVSKVANFRAELAKRDRASTRAEESSRQEVLASREAD